jgi:hypothetical protein
VPPLHQAVGCLRHKDGPQNDHEGGNHSQTQGQPPAPDQELSTVVDDLCYEDADCDEELKRNAAAGGRAADRGVGVSVDCW